MKRFIYIIGIALLTLSQSAFAQNIGDLSGIYYQAVAIDENGKEIVGMDVEGKPLYNKAIGVRFTITQGLDGAIQWQETHTTTTDKYGLFSLVIGQGSATASSAYARLLDIPWIDADQFLKVELATKNDGNFQLVSNQQFMTVPYAFYTDDIADDAITTAKILNNTILNEDIGSGAIDTRTILDGTIINEDIATGAIDTRTILDGTVINEDIATAAIDSRTILDGTLLNKDVATGAIDSRTILNHTIINEDIATGSVDSRAILDSTIVNMDISTGAVDSRTILDGSILNEDIADGTIDLTGKVTGILPVANGGTGLSGSVVTNGQLLIGNGTDGNYDIANLTPGTGIIISNTPGSIVISSSVVGGDGINSITAGSINVGEVHLLCPGGRRLDADATWRSDLIPVAGVEMGNIVIASLNYPLSGCMLTASVESTGNIRVTIYNSTGEHICFGTDSELRVLVVQ